MESLKRIIVVDDINYTLQAYKHRLKKYYQIFLAQTTQKLFELLDLFIPDLILLDINMPQIDGFEAIKLIKADSAYANIPVIFCTSQKDKQVVYRGISLGAVDFVFKPFTDVKIIESIENQLNPEKREAHRPKILAIDDNPSILKSIYYSLNNQFSVYTLTQPEKMEELLVDIKPDLFLFDYKMPELNGFDLIRILRKTLIFSNTPVIMITSEGTLDKILDAQCYGATDFIVKPFSDEILREKIAYHLVNYMFWRKVR